MMWQPRPEIAVFWLSGSGVLSPGATPPHDLPPSVERMKTICCPRPGRAPPWSRLQQVYIGPILWSRGLFGPPSGVCLLSIASQFLSSRNSAFVTGLALLLCTTIGLLHGLCGALMWRFMFQPLALDVPPGESRTNE